MTPAHSKKISLPSFVWFCFFQSPAPMYIVLQACSRSVAWRGAQRWSSAAKQSASRACIICLSSHTMCDRRNLNVSRRLMYMLKVSGLPRVGGAHTLRKRYVQVKHALLILQGKCTRESITKAKQELLEGWSSDEEQHSEVGGYQHRLLNVIDDIQTELAAMAMGEWVLV